jgi:hypothetical protein
MTHEDALWSALAAAPGAQIVLLTRIWWLDEYDPQPKPLDRASTRNAPLKLN